MPEPTPPPSSAEGATKTCSSCREVKSLEDFPKDRTSSDGLHGNCKTCRRVTMKAWRSNNPRKSSDSSKRWRSENPHRRAEYAAEYYRANSAVIKAQALECRLLRPEATMLARAKSRATKGGHPFSLTREDIVIPDRCPILGIPLVVNSGRRGGEDNSPSLDKIVPALGYVRGNVEIISNRANRIKSDASLEEVEAVAAWLARHVAPAPRKRKNPA